MLHATIPYTGLQTQSPTVRQRALSGLLAATLALMPVGAAAKGKKQSPAKPAPSLHALTAQVCRNIGDLAMYAAQGRDLGVARSAVHQAMLSGVSQTRNTQARRNAEILMMMAIDHVYDQPRLTPTDAGIQMQEMCTQAVQMTLPPTR